MTPSPLAAQLEQLRAIRILLEAIPDGERHDHLVARARVVAAAVRQIRGVRVSNPLDSAQQPSVSPMSPE
jgi:hypothetical protein